ncbi:hypothetical protein OIU77_020766 [Salix suchowensis]|uniref:Uncharacterized protein n=1 Tax=Salix suchowensis TaxID=1278906 RepID=A0ABQ9C9C7_9ROSI|nr:hypothetical protein OIU77_020766 [Salix suchowensis]
MLSVSCLQSCNYICKIWTSLSSSPLLSFTIHTMKGCLKPFLPRFLLGLALSKAFTSSGSSSFTKIFAALGLARRSFATR